MPATDQFASSSDSLTSPADDAFAISPHDTNELSYMTRGIYVGADGNIVLVTKNGNEVTLTGVKAGSILPVRAKIVKSTNTTATGLIGLY